MPRLLSALLPLLLATSFLPRSLAAPPGLSPTPRLSNTTLPSCASPTSSNPTTAAPAPLNPNACALGCRKPCYDYAYCNGCDALTGKEYVSRSPPFSLRMLLVWGARRGVIRTSADETNPDRQLRCDTASCCECLC
ncbi:hypothetical protein B2J93_375 [Marssonina coronariae]|uniref:Uncharacterized protein n=1 Tax=Diplocarpon coronariae TaxID=2795749 RepID=A0A218ZAH2_9HELO|nr:hypothetical protein B2J93_375 [Marssonina coronariae]